MIATIYNEKGGAGKTTITTNLAIELVKKRKKVLLVDCDPQANLTSFFIKRGGANYEELKNIISTKSISQFFQNNNEDIIELEKNLFLIPADENTQKLSQWLNFQDEPNYVFFEKFSKLEKKFDLILLDLPPTRSIITANAFSTIDYLLLISTLDEFSYNGIQNIVTDFTKRISSKQCLKKGKIAGLIVNKKNLSMKKTNKSYSKALEGEDLITTIPFTSIAPQSQEWGKALSEMPINSKTQKEFIKSLEKITQSFLNKFKK